MIKLNRKLSFVAIAVLATFQAQADVRINGFANLTTGVTTEDTNVYGTTEDSDFSASSLFALQVSSDVNDKITATAQIVARGSDDYSAEFEWAYLSYQASDNSSLAVGRFRLPVFRYSDSIDVGYSYHWITAPKAVYDVAFNNLNGVRYDYSNYSGDLEYLFRFSYGNYNEEISGGEVDGKDVILASAEGNYNGFKGRLVWGRGLNTFSQPSLDAAIDSIAAASPQLADELQMADDTGIFLGLGLEYDNFDWFVSSEYTVVETEDSFSAEDVAYYVTAGIRLGKWTPHLTFQARDGEQDLKFTDTVASLPAPLQAVLGPTNAGLQATFFEDFSIVTLGVRYDAMQNVALKAEISKYDNKIETPLRADPVLDTNVLNVSVNYVF